jgi:hypothetical protein
MCSLRQPGHVYSLESPDRVQQRTKSMIRQQQQGGVQVAKLEPQDIKTNDRSTFEKVPDKFGLLDSISPRFTFTAGGTSSPFPAPAPVSTTRTVVNTAYGKVTGPDVTSNHATPTTDHVTGQRQSFHIRNQVSS